MGESVAPIRGEITEIVGRPSSGRTSYLLACLSHVVGQGETAALVDAEETFDPRSAAQAGGKGRGEPCQTNASQSKEMRLRSRRS